MIDVGNSLASSPARAFGESTERAKPATVEQAISCCSVSAKEIICPPLLPAARRGKPMSRREEIRHDLARPNPAIFPRSLLRALFCSRRGFGPSVMAALIDADDADASVVPRAQARNGPVARKKMDDAIEPKCLGKNDIDRKSMGENSNP